MDRHGSNDYHLEAGGRLELLTFYLGSGQLYGINVLKVKEIISCPELIQVPQSHPAVEGISHMRGETITIIDLAQAIGQGRMRETSNQHKSVIVTEFSRMRQGFLVGSVDRIVYCEWKDILPPPVGLGAGSYITGITELDGKLLEIIDVEKVLGEVVGMEQMNQYDLQFSAEQLAQLKGRRILVVDDSSLALKQTRKTLESVGIECLTARDGKDALDILKDMASEGVINIDLIISDIEMPEMDGYTLSREIRNDPMLKELYILLHTSLTGAINTKMANQAGANDYLTKFEPNELLNAILRVCTQ